MQMLYNSDSFVVVRFEMSPDEREGQAESTTPAQGAFDIVDKLARKEILIVGALARKFQLGVQALAQTQPTPEQLDEYIAGFTEMAQHPLTLH